MTQRDEERQVRLYYLLYATTSHAPPIKRRRPRSHRTSHKPYTVVYPLAGDGTDESRTIRGNTAHTRRSEFRVVMAYISSYVYEAKARTLSVLESHMMSYLYGSVHVSGASSCIATGGALAGGDEIAERS